jgi:hypothetical protein
MSMAFFWKIRINFPRGTLRFTQLLDSQPIVFPPKNSVEDIFLQPKHRVKFLPPILRIMGDKSALTLRSKRRNQRGLFPLSTQ